MARYLILKGTRSFSFDDECVIGRHASCDVPLPEDRSASRRHAALFASAHGIVIEDLQSKNGVWVDGERVRGRRLLVGTHCLRIGKTDLTLVPGEANAPIMTAVRHTDEVTAS